MLGSDKAIRRVIFVASFLMIWSLSVNLIQAQSLPTTAIVSNVIPNTYMVRVSSAWIKSILKEPSSVYLSNKLKCQDESFGLYRFVGNESVGAGIQDGEVGIKTTRYIIRVHNRHLS